VADLLTSEDLEEVADAVPRGQDPAEAIAALVAAVDERRLADPYDASYALTLAAGLAEAHGDLQTALVHARRAASVDPTGHLRGNVARLLVEAGRAAEGLAVLEELRPQLGTDLETANEVIEILEEMDRIDLAVDWADTALPEAYARWTLLTPDHPDYREQTLVAERLCAMRAAVRADLGLPQDELDGRRTVLRAAVNELRRHSNPTGGYDDDSSGGYDGDGEGNGEGDGAVLALYWPQPDFEQLIARAPELSTMYGATWDEHRSKVEEALAMLSATGVPRVAILWGSFDELAAFAAIRNHPITDDDLRDEWAGLIEDIRAWPPPRNEPCWCGSELNYEKCCLPRSRVAQPT
jgi:hypothetical protein